MSDHERRPIEPTAAEERHARLCALVLGELDLAERAALEAELATSPELCAERDRLEATIGLVTHALPAEELSPAVQATLRRAAEHTSRRRRFRFLSGGAGFARLAAAAVVVIGASLAARTWLIGGQPAPAEMVHTYSLFGEASPRPMEETDVASLPETLRKGYDPSGAEKKAEGVRGAYGLYSSTSGSVAEFEAARDSLGSLGYGGADDGERPAAPTQSLGLAFDTADADALVAHAGNYRGAGDTAPPGGPASPGPSTGAPAPGSAAPPATVGAARGGEVRYRQRAGRELQVAPARRAPKSKEAEPALVSDLSLLLDPPFDSEAFGEVRVPVLADDPRPTGQVELLRRELEDLGYTDEASAGGRRPVAPEVDPDELILRCRLRPQETPLQAYFRCWGEHPFVLTPLDPQSTFAVDVDTASYALARRTLRAGRLPVLGQVRTEEFVNYFRADVAPPTRDAFAIDLELAPSRFGQDPELWMLRVAVRGRDVHELDRQPLALTFVVDVSGSMDDNDRLVLVKAALKELLAKLSVTDSVAIVAFSQQATVVSPMVSAGNARGMLEDALDRLVAKGGTNVEAGLQQGFRLAADALTPGAVNRVVFLSDGVGNIGETDQERILASVEEQRAKGLYLNTVGVGLEDHADGFLEQLADRGDGVCDYVDSMRSVRRALIENFTGAFQPIARDVKIQVEFDPSLVHEYRQLGYENRALADADFRRDEVDAGEVNAGHQVTALYELRLAPGAAASPTPFATVRLRYKPPFAVDAGRLDDASTAAAEVATERERAARPDDAVNTWAATTYGYRRAVLAAQFAELLRRSVFARDDVPAELLTDAEALAREGADGDVDELVELIRLAVPLLAANRAAMDQELDRLLRELTELHYRRGQRELLGEAPPSEADLAAEDARLAELENALRRHLQPEPTEAEPAEAKLREIGYTQAEDDR